MIALVDSGSTVNASSSSGIYSVVVGQTAVYSSDAAGYSFQFSRSSDTGLLRPGVAKSIYMGSSSGFLALSSDGLSLYGGSSSMFSYCAVSSLSSLFSSCQYLDTTNYPILYPVLTVYVSPDALYVYTGDSGGQISM